MAIDRRAFVRLAGCAVAASMLPGCAAQTVEEVAPRDGVIRLPLSRYPQLARTGGSLKVRPAAGDATIYVLVLGDGRVAALSPICTHLGCTVGIEGALLVCPCHGSTYDREGRVLRGPAQRALRSFPVMQSGDQIIIELAGAA